ncbi:MAG: N-acetylmuramoyl-L-alanine amidase [bacterium]|nr:N-acetylmuramoyl-L-alanine amidase [bacterium]
MRLRFRGMGGLGLALLVEAFLSGKVLGASTETLSLRPPMRWVPAWHADPRPAGSRIRYLILHDTETPGVSEARVIARHFRNPDSAVSAHFIIGKRGEILQCVPEEWRAWHAGESYLDGFDHLNDISLGIELVNAQTGHDPFPSAQLRSLEALLVYLMVRHEVPWSRVLGHRQVTLKPDMKRDPADNFPWALIGTAVRDQLARFEAPDGRAALTR